MFPGEKRANEDHAFQKEGKRSRHISRDVLEAIQKNMFNDLLTNIENNIRKVVAEEVDRALSRRRIEWSALPMPTTGSLPRKLRLQFSTNPKTEMFTGSILEGEHGDTIRIMLIDAKTGQLVTTGAESVSTLEVLPLTGDFNALDEDEWTPEEFENHVAKDREGKGQLLVGELKVCLREGMATLGQLYFTDNSRCNRSKKFRLGVRVAQNSDSGLTCIREAKSQAFTVKDSRGKAYMKHDTPSPNDYVWRLRNIRKDGTYHEKLMQHGVNTVKDFLLFNKMQPHLMKEILGKMSAKAYQSTIEHAQTCVLGDKMYIYSVNHPPYKKVIFNQNYQIMCAVSNGQYVDLDKLDGREKVQMDAIVKNVYEHWPMNVTECTLEEANQEEQLITAAAPFEIVEGIPSSAYGLENQNAGEASEKYMDNHALGGWNLEDMLAVGCLGHSGFDVGFESLDDQKDAIDPDIIASYVNDVMRDADDDYGYLLDLSTIAEPRPTVGRWWLRIRTVVRCALFINKAQAACLQQRDHPVA